MDIRGYDPRPESEEEKWEHFCESKEKGMLINKGEYCKFCGQHEEDEKGMYSWLGKYGI
jgi:hypothetical protein|tara:strand:- start:13 stop:189 length:177 start_codon:yes stop_codon:yes gene_type:complete